MIETCNILIIADYEFKNDNVDKEKYIPKLYEVINKKHSNKNIILKTVTGRYTLGLDLNLKLIEVDDRNKTSFVKSLNDSIDKIDEVIMITNFPKEPFLETLQNQLNENGIGMSIYGYETKSNGKA